MRTIKHVFEVFAEVDTRSILHTDLELCVKLYAERLANHILNLFVGDDQPLLCTSAANAVFQISMCRVSTPYLKKLRKTSATQNRFQKTCAAALDLLLCTLYRFINFHCIRRLANF